MRFDASYGQLTEVDGRYKVKPRKDLLDLLDIRPASILEVGCADGTNLLFFRDQLVSAGVAVERLTGVDSQRTRNCRNYERFDFVHATAEAFIDACRERFDLILLSDVVEHLYNPWRALTALRERLTEDGRLLVSVPNLQNAQYVSAVLSGRFYYEDSGLFDVTHIRFFSAETLVALLQGCGYELRRTGYRPDMTLASEVDEWRRMLDQGKRPTISLGPCTIAVTMENIEALGAQQLLVCASKSRR